jgi:hypothetical protein
VKKLLAEAMPLFRSYQKNVKRLVQLRDPGGQTSRKISQHSSSGTMM